MIEIIHEKVISITTESPEDITTVVDKYKIDGDKVLIPFNLGNMLILKNLGFTNVPSPIETQYTYPGLHKPFSHQRSIASFLTLNRRAYNFGDLGIGKTKSAIWAADYLLSIGAIRRVLVIAPLSILDSAWKQEIFRTVMHRSVDVAHGTKEKREAIINSKAEFILINYDGVEIVIDALDQGNFDLIIIDEANYIKNVQTRKHKFINKLVKADTWCWLMTATPAAQSPCDAYGLARMIDPKSVPRSYGAFRDMVQYKINLFMWINKPDAERTVHRVLQPAIRFTKSECLDLPELLYETREVPLTAQQNKYYKLLKKEMLILAAGTTVTAANAAVLIGKLLQISAGNCYDERGDIIEFDISNRFRELCDIIRETRNKTIVFVQFRNSIERIMRMLQDEGITCEAIHGKIPMNKRDVIFSDFQNKPDPQVLIIQPQAAAHGVTLTKADTTIWFGVPMSFEIYQQGNGRTHRAGQKNQCTVIHLIGSDVEKKVLNALDKKNMSATTLLALFKEVAGCA
jgi:SNF2 family DNA or RNA helicase